MKCGNSYSRHTTIREVEICTSKGNIRSASTRISQSPCKQHNQPKVHILTAHKRILRQGNVLQVSVRHPLDTEEDILLDPEADTILPLPRGRYPWIQRETPWTQRRTHSNPMADLPTDQEATPPPPRGKPPSTQRQTPLPPEKDTSLNSKADALDPEADTPPRPRGKHPTFSQHSNPVNAVEHLVIFS